MTYITRDDGEHFVIPSYRDVLTTKQKSLLKSEILSLSKSYGEYITLQRKAPTKYEVAFSSERGYLLGESVWHFFDRPFDMVYCEEIHGTTDAILVIVKSGSVYLDGSFPIDTIPEELVVFLTEQNNFEIYIHGDIPISETPEDGKFSFDSNSIKKFTVLEKPVFPTLPLLKSYQFDLVDNVLKQHGIGVFPLKQTIAVLAVIGMGWWLWSHFSPSEEEQAPAPEKPQVNPFKGYYDALNSTDPGDSIAFYVAGLTKLYGLPGWNIKNTIYRDGVLNATVTSQGSPLKSLYEWAKLNNAIANIGQQGVMIMVTMPLEKRGQAQYIYPIRAVLVEIIDKIASVYPGNNIQLGEQKNLGSYSEMAIAIRLSNVSPGLLAIIGKLLSGYPITLQNMPLSVDNGSLNGTINLLILGR